MMYYPSLLLMEEYGHSWVFCWARVTQSGLQCDQFWPWKGI